MIKLVAIDLDGTLFNSRSTISDSNRDAIIWMSENGLYPVISTGRPFNGIPEMLKTELPFKYAITTNGSGVYDVRTGECIYSNSMSQELALPLIEYIDTKRVHMDAFVDGESYSTTRSRDVVMDLPIPPELRAYILDTRSRVDDLSAFIRENGYTVQKLTLNFFRGEDGEFVDRAEVKSFLESNPDIDIVSGGFNNLEVTKKGVHKGVALKKLAEYLNLDIDETMAIGDTENDLAIIQTAGIGVAMANAIPEVLDAANYITASNDEDGVAKAIYHFCRDNA